MPRYNPSTIEPKWQRYWAEHQTFATPRLPRGEKLYILDMFPYPSGEGLHVGHPEGYTATDILARFERMRGKSVMHPMGWDAFGLPAEQHAKKTGTPPRVTTEKNTATFRRQLQMLGFSYDWQRELATTDPDYFRWTQWIFLQLYDTWFDHELQRGRPMSELPIPADVRSEGPQAVRRYQDEQRLAYQSEAPVNWCPALGTVLANEEVVGGVSERGGHPVMRVRLRQWMLRITAYADRLEKDLDELDWSPSIKALQRNWIGRSTGAEVDFFIGPSSGSPDGRPSAGDFKAWRNARGASGFPRHPGDDAIRIYTTRPDTLFGATYMVIAPEHPLVARLTRSEQADAVRAYCEQAARKSDLDRTDLAKEKTGVFTGSFAVNPANNRPVPIWVADYVLASYGTGAIMAVPAHDTRDFEFATAFELPIVPVVDPGDDDSSVDRQKVLAGTEVFTGDGIAINSSSYNGLATAVFKDKITGDLNLRGYARQAVNYKLRDWLFSRQHFWGEPFPILHELDAEGKPTGLVRTVPAGELPLKLPEIAVFDSHGSPEPPLDQAPQDWLYPVIDGVRYKRETNTMPQWAGSCWYYLRFLDPKNDKMLVDPAVEKAWMPVDIYIGGAEHAVLHLLYARFWHKVLYDRGLVSGVEPFRKLVNQGMILGEMELTGYQKSDGAWASVSAVTSDEAGGAMLKATGEALKSVKVSPEQAEKSGEGFALKADSNIRLESRAYKMSKARGNVVNPDVVVKEYGADSLRLYEMFMGPLEATKPWSMEGVNGVRGFLDRVWRMIVNERSETLELSPSLKDVEPTAEQNRVLHKTIHGVTQDLERMAFNTAIAKMMEFTNYFLKCDVRPRAAMEKLVLLLAPLAPHIAEELSQLLGHDKTLAYEPWPAFDPAAVHEDSIEIPVQIKGKLRARIMAPVDASEADLERIARADPRIAELLAGQTLVKVITVKGRMVNFVTR
jgi:leucyl-tRNA synthetase